MYVGAFIQIVLKVNFAKNGKKTFFLTLSFFVNENQSVVSDWFKPIQTGFWDYTYFIDVTSININNTYQELFYTSGGCKSK